LKPTASIRDVKIYPASYFFGPEQGGFVAYGGCVSDESPRGFVGRPVRTSLIVSFDAETGVIETMNTLYKIVK
jgi:hypothetical protein